MPRAPVVARALSLALVLALALLAGCTAPEPPAPLETASVAGGGIALRAVHFAPGADAGPSHISRYVPRYQISGDGASLDVEIAGVPESTLTIPSFARLANDDAAPHAVALHTARVQSPFVRAFSVRLAENATLDLLADAPQATLALAPGEVANVEVVLSLGAGARGTLSVAALRVDVMSS